MVEILLGFFDAAVVPISAASHEIFDGLLHYFLPTFTVVCSATLPKCLKNNPGISAFTVRSKMIIDFFLFS